MRKMSLLLCTLLIGLVSAPLFAGGFGLQANWNSFENGDGTDFGIGARVEIGGNLHFIGSFDYYFINEEGGILDDVFNPKFYEVNGNLAYALNTVAVRPYFGGGVSVARLSFDTDFFDESESELGFNVLGGVKFDAGMVSPFVELRYTMYDDEAIFGNRFVFTGGIVF